MAEGSWAEGYVVDVGYTHGFYRELTPSLLRFVALLGGHDPAGSDGKFTYYELGCGHGYSSTLLAAANPGGEFIGVDFNPTHIRNAQKLVGESGVPNVRFLEKSFAELLEMDLPDAEVVALHGVWTWISDEHRAQIVEFLRRRLKPGGIVYVSYNALPGLAQVAPLQRLFRELGGRGDTIERLKRSRALCAALDKAGAEYFRANPIALARLHHMGQQEAGYLAHEYFNDNWSLFYHVDVARQLAEAKLTYAGSAALLENFDPFTIRPDVIPLLGAAPDRSTAETLRDYARNQVFRRDVFTRGAGSASEAEREALLGRTRFALARPRASCQLTGRTPLGEVALQPEQHAPVLDALSRGPLSFDELCRALDAGLAVRAKVRQAVFALAAFGEVLPVPAAPAAEAKAVAQRFNRAVLARPAASRTISLASPVLGTAVPISFLDRVFLGREDAAAGIADAQRLLSEGAVKLRKGEAIVSSAAEAQQVIEERARFFYGGFRAYLQQVGVL